MLPGAVHGFLVPWPQWMCAQLFTHQQPGENLSCFVFFSSHSQGGEGRVEGDEREAILKIETFNTLL